MNQIHKCNIQNHFLCLVPATYVTFTCGVTFIILIKLASPNLANEISTSAAYFTQSIGEHKAVIVKLYIFPKIIARLDCIDIAIGKDPSHSTNLKGESQRRKCKLVANNQNFNLYKSTELLRLIKLKPAHRFLSSKFQHSFWFSLCCFNVIMLPSNSLRHFFMGNQYYTRAYVRIVICCLLCTYYVYSS